MITEMDEAPKPQGELTVQTVAMPKDTNASGDIFGGWLLSQMDSAGAIASLRSLAIFRLGGKGTSGRKRRLRRLESRPSASGLVRATRQTGTSLRAKMMPRVVPQVVVPITATIFVNGCRSYLEDLGWA